MDDYADAAVVCPLGHGPFILPAAACYRQCPYCDAHLIDVDDQTRPGPPRFAPFPHRDIRVIVPGRHVSALRAW